MNKPVEPPVQPSLEYEYLKDFTQHNGHCVVSVEDGFLLIDKPWGREDVRLRVNIEDHEFIADLNLMEFNPRFDAFLHRDTNTLEVFFGYLLPGEPGPASIMDRRFTLHFENRLIECGYAEPTRRLFHLAKALEQMPAAGTDRSSPQLAAFRDAQRLDRISESNRKWFLGRVPRSFFIKLNDDVRQFNLEVLARHINLLAHYYDRISPLVNIREEIVETSELDTKPMRMIEDGFPDALVMSPIDDIILQLLEVARTSQVRSAYLYYYQIFEYAGYYYIDEKARKALRNALRDPALIACGEEKVTDLFSIFTDLNHNDEAKMRKVIEDHCDPRVIWSEISNDQAFFSLEQRFDGGFTLPALVSKDLTEDGWKTMWMPKTFDVLTKIRNAIVHAREKRENKVILPSKSNNKKLQRYLPVIERMAEQLALKS